LPNGEIDVAYYPSPVSRKKPTWIALLPFGFHAGKVEAALADLLGEIYEAVAGGQHRLAAMGIRAVLEQVMILKVGDLRTFDEKIEAFHKAGYVSLIQLDAMRETLEIGHAAMHRSFKPNEDELTTALDIVEGILAAIFDHAEAARQLAKRVPPKTVKRKEK
jgi:hypothetical protein